MFGAIRFFLAFSVVLMHLTPATRIGGYQAVFSFYILSGYLMTRVLNDTYGFTINGRVHFLVNRFLRIFPPYWLAIIISILVILASPELAKSMNKGLVMPGKPTEWLLNLFIFFHSPPGVTPRLIPPVWTLHVEWVYYFLMCLFLSRSRKVVYAWFGLSLTLTIGMFLYSIIIQNKLVDTMYFSTLAGSLPFSAGALVYFIAVQEKQTLESAERFIAYVLLVILFYAFSTILHYVYPELFWPLFYCNILVSALAVYKLHFIRASSLYKQADRILGDLSYPIYLLHWPVAVLVTLVFFHQTYSRTIYFFTITISATIAASLLVNFLVEKPISRIRDMVRSPGAEQKRAADAPKARTAAA